MHAVQAGGGGNAMSHAEPQGMSKEPVSMGGTGSGAPERRDAFLARPVPFADTLREMGRPRGWGAIRKGARLCIVKSK